MTKLTVMAAAAALSLAAPLARADQKLDQAVAKAEEQILKNKPEEALKGMTKFAEGANSGEAFLALARIQEKTGDVEAAASHLGVSSLGLARRLHQLRIGARE